VGPSENSSPPLVTQAGYGPVQAYWDVSGAEAALNSYSEITAFSNFSNLKILNLLVKKNFFVVNLLE